MVPEGRMVKPDADDGHGGHLVDVYAHNAVEERGRFTLPSYFLDELAVECGKMILEKGAEVAERCAHDRIIEFLIKMEKAKHEDNERKVRARLPHESRERRDS
jgi:hypothetical protein